MLAQLTGVDTVAKTDLAVPENNVNIQVQVWGRLQVAHRGLQDGR
jgi:hypothetical protein